MKKHFPILPFFGFSILLALISWTGLGLIMIYTKPTLGPRWLFFFLFFLAISGSFLPVFTLIHQRTHIGMEFSFNAPVRQALMLASFADLVVWLQMGRVLDVPTGTFIFAILLGIEILIQLFDRSRWKPDEQAEKSNEA